MTAQHHQPPLTDRPAETPAAIRAALAASAVPEVLAQYEAVSGELLVDHGGVGRAAR